MLEISQWETRIHCPPLSDLSEQCFGISGLNVARITWNFEWYQLCILVGPGGNRHLLFVASVYQFSSCTKTLYYYATHMFIWYFSHLHIKPIQITSYKLLGKSLTSDLPVTNGTTMACCPCIPMIPLTSGPDLTTSKHLHKTCLTCLSVPVRTHHNFLENYHSLALTLALPCLITVFIM